MNQKAEFEYIVVGSGAGGGTLAARLAENGCRVLVLEAGRDGREHRGYRRFDNSRNFMPDDYDVPAFHALSTENDSMLWDFWVRHYSDQAKQERDRKYRKTWGGEEVDGILYPRAGTLGGCTAHNAMIMVYPHNKDWDDVAELTGDPSWKAEKMRKYFERMENCRYRGFWRFLNLFGFNPSRHGFKGWVDTEVSIPVKDLKKDLALVRAIRKAARVALTEVVGKWKRIKWFLQGLADHNDWRLVKDDSFGIRYAPLSTRNHRRRGTRDRLLEVKKAHPNNLTIELDALACKVIFDDANHAIGVEYLKGERLYQAHHEVSQGQGESRRKYASKEVILAGGAFNTPQLLMLSGIGPRAELEKHGIDVRVHLPGVGSNLQDRYEVGVVNRMKKDWEVLRGATFGVEQDPQYREWQAGGGVYGGNGSVLAVIKRSSAERELPDLFCFALVGRFEGYEPEYSKRSTESHNYLTWAVLKAHTENTAGTVTLRSSDPRERPEINFHYFDEGSDHRKVDLESVVDGVQFVRKMTDAFRDLVEEEELPGDDRTSRDQIRRYVEDNAWGHHASCTCSIGPKSDPMAVLDSNFRVRGVSGLRVVDASVFPRIPGFFIVTSIYMIGEKAAEVILADYPTS